jgi:adenylate cyclase
MGIMSVQVGLLGPFSVSQDGRVAGPWPRPTARRLCQFVLVSSGRRVSRDLVSEELFGDLDPRAAARAVSKALSMARAGLAALNDPLLDADLTHIWAAPGLTIDAEVHEAALRAALDIRPGNERDRQLAAALKDERELLADEPYAAWAMAPRDRLETLRQTARLTLARDRSMGAGLSGRDAVTEAWRDCFEHDPGCEEAAIALMRARPGREQAALIFERCAAALDELGLKPSAPLEDALAAAAADAPRTAAAAAPEELRTVTVLSAEVSAAGLGLESLRELVASSLAAVIGEVESLGGSVTSVSGNGLQAVFGAPSAHEDDPERALRAAFRALAGTNATNATKRRAVRIGIETGTAILGSIGGGSRVEYAPVGDVVSTATTLQALASAGQALIGPVTRAAAGQLFTWTGSVDLPGGITGVYLGSPRPGARGRPLGLGGSGPLAGRRDELGDLDAAFGDAARGDGSVAIVTGEPGLGKTRLVEEFHKRLVAGRGRPPLWLEGRGTSYASSTPYSLYQQLLAYVCGVTPDLPESVVRPALERMLTRIKGSDDLFPPLARMMGLPAGAAMGRKTPREIHRATFAAWERLMTGLLAISPAILVLEDLHWADPTSRQLTEQLAGLTAHRPLLMIITTRPHPEGMPGFSIDGATDIRLRPLAEDAERALASSLVGPGATPDILDAVLTNVDGNPLFLEERLSSLLETGALVRENGALRLNSGMPSGVPQVLERLVRSRVDRLSPAARDVVRHACVLGFEFPLSLLAAVCAVEGPLDPVLDELRAKDILHDVDGLPESAFRFRHALIQEATYSGLPRAERRLLHGRAAWALEAAYDGRIEDVAALLGRHFAAAGEPGRAVTYLEMAGDQATSAFANDEAIAAYRSAMAIVDERPASDAGAAVDLRAKLANVLWRIGRWEQAREAFEEAIGLPDNGDTLRTAHLWTRLGRLEMAYGRYEAAEKAFDTAEVLLGDDRGEEWLEMMVDGRASLYGVNGHPERALAALETVRPVLETIGSPGRKFSYYSNLVFGRTRLAGNRVEEQDITDIRRALAAARLTGEEKDAGYATYFLGWVLWLHGDLDGSEELQRQALEMAERIGESLLIWDAVLGLARNGLRRHDTDAVRDFGGRALAIATATGTSWQLAEARSCLAWLAWREQRPEYVLALADEIADDDKHLYGWIYLWPLLAIQLDSGRLDDAVAAARALLDPERHRLPDVLRSPLNEAIAAWESGHQVLVAERLAATITLAQEHRYA